MVYFFLLIANKRSAFCRGFLKAAFDISKSEPFGLATKASYSLGLPSLTSLLPTVLAGGVCAGMPTFSHSTWPGGFRTSLNASLLQDNKNH